MISAAHELIDFVVDYVENVRDRQVLPSVRPGYLKPLIPDKPPYRAESWGKIMPDIERYIMPGVSTRERRSPYLTSSLIRAKSFLVGAATF